MNASGCVCGNQSGNRGKNKLRHSRNPTFRRSRWLTFQSKYCFWKEVFRILPLSSSLCLVLLPSPNPNPSSFLSLYFISSIQAQSSSELYGVWHGTWNRMMCLAWLLHTYVCVLMNGWMCTLNVGSLQSPGQNTNRATLCWERADLNLPMPLSTIDTEIHSFFFFTKTQLLRVSCEVNSICYGLIWLGYSKQWNIQRNFFNYF